MQTTKKSLRVNPLPEQEILTNYFTYEPVSGQLIRKKRTANRHKVGEIVGSLRSDGYLSMGFMNVSYFVHRVVWKMVSGYDPLEVDHINGIRSDNRLENLREVDYSGNSHNVRAKGYVYIPKINKYRAVICINGKNTDVGYFESEEEARDAYVKAKIKLQGFCR